MQVGLMAATVRFQVPVLTVLPPLAPGVAVKVTG